MPSDQLTHLLNEVNRIIFDLIHSTETSDKIAGIMAIGKILSIIRNEVWQLNKDQLIDCPGEDNATKVTRFANYLRSCLPGNDPQISVYAAKALGTSCLSFIRHWSSLGHLSQTGGVLTADFVEFEMKRALEWIQNEKNDLRKYASTLVIKELVLSVPALTFAYLGQVFDVIWSALKDQKVWIFAAFEIYLIP
jgi:FKBP12-rapamycin complex-associated protein